MSNMAYEKLISKLLTQIKSVEVKIEMLPSVDISSLLVTIVKTVLGKSTKPVEIDGLYEELNNIRGKALTAIDTYARTVDKPTKDIILEDRQTLEKMSEKDYLAQIRHVLNEVARLENLLKQKDVRQGSSHSTQHQSRKAKGFDTDLGDLNLK